MIPLSNQKQYYNILAIDGGGIRGIIPGVIIKEMEKYAYEYATSKNYKVPKYPGIENKFALKDLFDMVAGTSTGSILAAGLTYPDSEHIDIKKPKFFADDILKIYSERGDEIFVQVKIDLIFAIIYIVVFGILFSFVGYCIGVMIYDSPTTRKAFK